MPHLGEVWDQSDSDSDTTTTTGFEHLFETESNPEPEDDVVEHQPTRVQQQQQGRNNEIQPSDARQGRGNTRTMATRSLPVAGYLYKDKVDIKDIIDPKDLGLMVLQARRKGGMEKFYSPEKYTGQVQSMMAAMESKKEGRTVEDMETWGDEIGHSNKWPKIDPKGHIRIMFYNVHGISYKQNYFEMDMIMQMGGQVQADVILLAEVNLNMHKPGVRAKLRDSIKAYDKYAKIQMAYPPDEPFTTSDFNMGGNMAIVQGGLAGRCIEQGSDLYGRWSWVKIKGETNSLVIISGYKVGKSKGTPGGTSVAQQEIRAMMKRDHRLASKPREAFDADMIDFSIQQQNQGNEVLLMMDANTPLDSAEARAFIAAANLYSIAEYKFPNKKLPRTFQFGSQCIDICLVTRKLLEWIIKFGYFPFFMHSLFDHRGEVIDVRCNEFFGSMKVDETRRVTRKLRASNPRESDAYRGHLKSMLKSAGIFRKVKTLCDGFEDLTRQEMLRRWVHLQKYNITTAELMIAAENKLKPKHSNVSFWSPTLKKKGQELHYYNERVKADDEFGDMGINIQKPACIPDDDTVITTDDLHRKQTEVKNSWRETNKNGESIRKQHLVDRAERAHLTRNVTVEAALKQIINAETSAALHRRHGGVINTPHSGSLTKILVPFPDSSVPAPTSSAKCGVWKEIDDDRMINELFLTLNEKKLLLSQGSDFAPGGLLHGLVGDDGCSETADKILDGSFDATILQDENRSDVATLMAFVKHMERPRDKDGSQIPDMEWTYGAEEYQASFSKKNENTSCGPSGLHMSHWIAACDDEELSELHASFIEASFRIGLPYERWQTSYHAMIQKKGRAWANAMRIIQLLEGDYNAGLRFLIQRKGVAYAEKKNIYSGNTYGGRKGKNTHQVLGRIQATNEYCRLARTPAALADVDAVNCFDCMTHSGIGFFQRRQGSPKDLVRTQCETLMRTNHFIKTGLGVSTKSISRNETSKPQGSGQGGGASVGNWQSHNDPMILTFQDLCNACEMTTPDQKETLLQWMISFVDDNKILMNFQPCTPFATIYEAMKRGVKTWREVLRITGGELELEKTWIGMLLFDYNTFTGKHMGKHSLYRAGVPRLVNSNNVQQEIVLENGICEVTFRELEPNQGLRLLGVRMSLSGSFQDEFEYRKEQIQDLAGKLQATAFDERDAWLIYQTRYRPKIRYCLPITTFNDKQCSLIQSPFIKAFLNKLCMNRNSPRVVVWGPYKYGGLNIMNIEVEQFSSHLTLLIANIRKGNATGKSMLLAMGMYQITLGCEQPFWSLDPEFYPTQSPEHTTMQYLWNKLRKIKATMHLPTMWTPSTTYSGDSALIDDFVATARTRKGTATHVRPIQIEMANACRLYLRVTWLSEILTDDGDKIAPWAFFGRRRNPTNALTYPYQPEPPPHAWKEWRFLLTSTYMAASRVDMLNESIPVYNRQVQPLDTNLSTKSWPPPSRDISMSEIFEYMPAVWKQAIGSVDLPNDDGAELADVVRTGNTIRAWSDGSVDAGIGSHAYTLRSYCTGNDKAITGDAATPGNPDTISSLRSEHFGALAIMVIMLALEWKYSLEATGHILLHIDNMEVVNRTKYGVDDAMAADKHIKTDFDVWNETHKITQMLHTNVCAKWVKGHQDKYRNKKQGGVGPMPMEAHYNILVDRRAERRRKESTHTYPTLPMTSDTASVLINGTFITTKLDEHIRHEMTAGPLRDYIKRKNGWDDDEFNLVDWESFGAFMGRLSASKRAKVVKLQHNWQNTGRQKGLFLRSAGESAAAEEKELCPMKCGCYEASMHYLVCPKNPKLDEMQRGLVGIKTWMRMNDAAPGLSSILMRITRKFIGRRTDELDEWNFENEEEGDKDDFYDLVRDQKAIGWHSLFLGRLSKKWHVIQNKYFSTFTEDDDLPAYKTATWWTAGLIQQLIYFSLNTWQIRNDFLHKDKVETAKSVLRRKLQREMEDWYQRAPVLGATFRKFFRMTLLQRKTYSVKSIQSWLATVKEQSDYEDRKRAADDEAAAAQWRLQQLREERSRPRARLVGDSRPERRRPDVRRQSRTDSGQDGGRGRNGGRGRSGGRGRGGGRGLRDERRARTE